MTEINAENVEDTDGVGRRMCKEEDCEGAVEANPKLYLSAWADGTWSVAGVQDDAVDIKCDDNEHENYDELLSKGMSAFLETILPGATWAGSNPKHPLGTDTVTVQFSLSTFQTLVEQVPHLMQDAPVVHRGFLLG